jgi:hypothetical protein
MNLLLKLLLICAATWPAIQAAPPNGNQPAPFTLTISARPDAVKLGDKIRLHITLKNSSDQSTTIQRSPSDELAEQFCDVHVTDASGNAVPLTAYAKAARARQFSGSVIKVRLNPGETTDEDTLLEKQFNFSQPGDYVVQASRPVSDDPNDGTVASNKITISITQ